MKVISLVAAGLLCATILFAQQVDTIPKSAVINGNKITAIVNSNGLLFHNLETGEGGFFHEDYPDVPLIKSVGLWMGGIDPGGNLMTAVMHPDSFGRRDFLPGYIHPDIYGGKDFNIVAKVTGQEIFNHISDYRDNGVIDNPQPAIYGWPGAGNAFFEEYTGMQLPELIRSYLAPFYDENENLIYEPDLGDFPIDGVRGCITVDRIVIPNELVWTTAHDQTNHSLSEGFGLSTIIQPTIFTYNCDENELSQQTVYVNYRIINFSDEDLDSTFFGLYTDFDIGCPENDFIGTSKETETVFAYNSNFDEDCESEEIMETQPILSCNLGRGPSDEFRNQLRLSNTIVMRDSGNMTLPGTVFPRQGVFNHHPIHYYNYLAGFWLDGSPLEYGGDGYQEGTELADFIYPDIPNDSIGWSEQSSTLSTQNKSVLLSSGNFTLKPSAINEFIVAFSVMPNTKPDSLYKTSYRNKLYDYWAKVCDAPFDPCTQNFLDTVTTPEIPKPIYNSFLFPNPANDILTVNFDFENAEPSAITIYDSSGKLWYEEISLTEDCILNISDLHQGVYILETKIADETIRRKFIVSR